MKPPKRQAARSAAQVAMSKTNPTEPEEATDQSPRRIISGPPRFDQQPGAIGSVCKHCGRSIREHIEGFCDPQDATQHFAEQELEAEQSAGVFRDEGFGHAPIIEGQPQVRVRQHDWEQITHPRAGRKIRIKGDDTQSFLEGDYSDAELEPLPGSRLVDQALELIAALPDCAERDILLRHCALAVAHQMSIAGFSLREEEAE